MNNKTAVKNLNMVLRRIRAVNGILATPMHEYDAVKIKRVWLFGSFAKGKAEPNDVDLFVELVRFRSDFVPPCTRIGKINGRYLLDKDYYRRHGIIRPKQVYDTLIKWLRKDLRKVSVHIVGDDEIFSQLDTKILIYPRNDFKFNEGNNDGLNN